MSNVYLELDPHRVDPAKLVKSAEQLTQPGAICVIPTDTNYALGCRLGDKEGIDRIRQLRLHDKDHSLTLMLSGFKALGTYGFIQNTHFRMLKGMIPGPYTFILEASKEVPKIFAHPKRKTVGIRIPEQQQALDFIGASGPLITTTLKAIDSDEALSNLDEVLEWVRKVANVTIDIGPLTGGETSVVDLTGRQLEVVREGIGDLSFLSD